MGSRYSTEGRSLAPCTRVSETSPPTLSTAPVPILKDKKNQQTGLGHNKFCGSMFYLAISTALWILSKLNPAHFLGTQRPDSDPHRWFGWTVCIYHGYGGANVDQPLYLAMEGRRLISLCTWLWRGGGWSVRWPASASWRTSRNVRARCSPALGTLGYRNWGCGGLETNILYTYIYCALVQDV